MKTWFRNALCMALFALCLTGCALAQELTTAAQVAAYVEENHPQSMDIRGLPFEDVKLLLDTYPDVDWHYEIELCGIPVDSEATAVDLNANGALKPKPNAQEMYERLAYLPNLTQVDMYKEEMSSEDMGLLFDNYPGIRFGWTVKVGKWKVRTDAGAFSTLNPDPPPRRYKSEHFVDLRFCYQLRALDLGHNGIRDLSFLEPLTTLRVLILADNDIRDISPLANLRELQYVELFLNRITDLSPLANHPNLLDVNLSWNKAKDHTPILTLPRLQRLWYAKNGLTEEAVAELEAAFPNVDFEFYSSGSTAYGWRTHERYFVIKEMFNSKKREYIPFPNDPVVTE